VDAGGAQLAVYLHGRLVVDLWAGQDPIGDQPYTGDSVSVLMSVSKGLVATCVHLLGQRGLLDVEAPVGEYWPTFTANGKDRITIADLLSHRAGLNGFDPESGIGIGEMLDWDRCVTSLGNMAPLWTPGSAYQYHPFTHGYLLGEVVRRVTGITVGQFFADEIAGPLGLDLWIGLPESEEHRFVRQFSEWHPHTLAEAAQELAESGADPTSRLGRAVANNTVIGDDCVDGLNTRAAHVAEVPAAGGIGNARSLAKMYAATIGEIDGLRLLTPETVDRARTPQTDKLGPPPPFDEIPEPQPMRFGLGYDLPRPAIPEFGEGSFGHAGAGGRVGFAHPERGIAVGYTCTNMLWDPAAGPDDRWMPWTVALHDIVNATA
ncbi:MAG TPA: serine hydrolase domain-containing protein, partial [Pseudonocardiaceae bacterium]|nr:serine hydrolase domain-containing protein [Pseudonocardiaceae bacterium]